MQPNDLFFPREEPVDIIMPTMALDPQMLNNAVASILYYRREYPVRVIIVNNGKVPIQDFLPATELIEILHAGENLGWEGGLKAGLAHSKSKYVMFCNDDILIPTASSRWIKNMVRLMELYPWVGAIGPASNVVAGKQNMLHTGDGYDELTTYLIFFCVLIRREALDKAGGLDDSLPGGDDLDLSIRMQDVGYNLLVKKDAFVFHYGFQTGEALHGGPDKPNGWNSREMIERTQTALIKKHGFFKWWRMVRNDIAANSGNSIVDVETEVIIKYMPEKRDKIVELGCGAHKTFSDSVGIDIVPKGERIPYAPGTSVADITTDVTLPLPIEENSVDCLIARHILEHCLDTIQTLSNWAKVLAPTGRMIICCPNERWVDGVPITPTHLHAFTPESLERIAGVVGLKRVYSEGDYNNCSFTLALEKA